MTGDRQSGTPRPSIPQAEEQPCRPVDSILDALDMEVVEDVDIVFGRPVSHPRPATFD